MNLIILGPPGCGKGTLAEIIRDKINIPYISTGNVIRQLRKSDKKLGESLERHIGGGNLISDDLMLDLLKKELNCFDHENGFILDGFPRTLIQAELLEKLNISIFKVIYIEVEDEIIFERLKDRKVCSNCGKSYNIKYNPPLELGKCDVCASKIIKRLDDQPEIIKKRLNIFRSETEPLKEFYKLKNKILIVDGSNNIKNIADTVLNSLEV